MSNSLHALFDDAHRRVCIAKQKGNFESLEKVWAGMGYPSEFKEAKQFFRPLRDAEPPRVMGWYFFTKEGMAEYERRYAGKPDWFETNAD